MNNIYYIIPTNSAKLNEWLNSDIVVENELSNLRTNVPESLYVIKTKRGDTMPLEGAGVGYTYAQILNEMSKPNWNPIDDI
jgi:hypothetical protein